MGDCKATDVECLQSSQVDITTLYFPVSMATLFGSGQTWAFGGTFLT